MRLSTNLLQLPRFNQPSGLLSVGEISKLTEAFTAGIVPPQDLISYQSCDKASLTWVGIL